MQVLFVSFHNPNSIGVHKKVMQQINFFELSGIEVQAILINEHYHSSSNDGNIQFVKPSDKPVLPSIFKRRFFRYFNEYLYQHKLNKIRYSCLKKLVSKVEFNVIYFRYPFCSLPLLKFTKSIKNKIIFEHNTVELNEIKGSLNNSPELHYYYLCEKYLTKKVFKNALLGVAVTEEIANAENAKAGSNYASFIYKNPILVSNFNPRAYVSRDKYNIAILIGSYDEWHGLDLFCDAIRKEGKMDYYSFTYIGNVSDRVKEIFSNLVVNFTGPLDSSAIREKFEQCDITIGSLATYRFNVKELSSLKTREYMAMGIPFIIGCKDTAFQNANDTIMDYVKIIDFKNEKNALSEVENFIELIKKDTNHPCKLNEFAQKELDFKPVFTSLIEHIRTNL